MLNRHDDVVRRFAAALGAGDLVALEAVIGAQAVAVCDGGGRVGAPERPVRGAHAIARLVVALLSGQPEIRLTVEAVNGRAGLVLRRDGTAMAVVSFSVENVKVVQLWIVLNPDKLHAWHRR